MSYVVIKIGSKARGDHNPDSDEDLVCIYDGAFPTIDLRIDSKFSLQFFSLDTCSKMAKQGSLFLTHIDVDGFVLFGDKSLCSVYINYRPDHTLVRNNLLRTRAAISEIEWFPDSPKGFSWLCDFLYVSLRNLIFCDNALVNIFNFNYTKSFYLWYSRNFNSLVPEDNILLLRKEKYNFRSGNYQYDPKTLESINDIFSLIIGRPHKLSAGGKTNWNKTWNYDYWDERILERAAINNEVEFLDLDKYLKNHNYYRNVLKSQLRRIISSQIKGSSRPE